MRTFLKKYQDRYLWCKGTIQKRGSRDSQWYILVTNVKFLNIGKSYDHMWIRENSRIHSMLSNTNYKNIPVKFKGQVTPYHKNNGVDFFLKHITEMEIL